MRQREGYRTEPLGFNRRMVAASVSVHSEANTIHFVTEADISAARHLIALHRERTGERLSLTGYVVSCLAQTMAEFPRLNAFRKGGRLVLLDDVTISVLFERDDGGEAVPEPVGIRQASRKTLRQINDELRDAQASWGGTLGASAGLGWVRLIPGPLLRTFIRLASHSITMQKRYGVVGVTAVGMFGRGAMWLVPLSSATVSVAVGSIARRDVLVEGVPNQREILCLTVSFDHDIVDGAPAARFVSRFTEMLSEASELHTLVEGP